MDVFAKRLRELRKSKRVYQKEIAELLNIVGRQYIRYEAGEVDPPVSKVITLANYYNVSVDYLLGLSDNPERK